MIDFKHAVVAAALFAGTGMASAQTTIIAPAPATSGTAVVTSGPVQLTPVQRQTVYRTIVRERVNPTPPTVTYEVGTRVPGNVQLYAVPESVAVEVPAVRAYKYMVVNGRVVLVDPATSEVAAELSD